MITRPSNRLARRCDTSTLPTRRAVSTASASLAGRRTPSLADSRDMTRRPAWLLKSSARPPSARTDDAKARAAVDFPDPSIPVSTMIIRPPPAALFNAG